VIGDGKINGVGFLTLVRRQIIDVTTQSDGLRLQPGVDVACLAAGLGQARTRTVQEYT
jgi:hypothetical protein